MLKGRSRSSQRLPSFFRHFTLLHLEQIPQVALLTSRAEQTAANASGLEKGRRLRRADQERNARVTFVKTTHSSRMHVHITTLAFFLAPTVVHKAARKEGGSGERN